MVDKTKKPVRFPANVVEISDIGRRPRILPRDRCRTHPFGYKAQKDTELLNNFMRE